MVLGGVVVGISVDVVEVAPLEVCPVSVELAVSVVDDIDVGVSEVDSSPLSPQVVLATPSTSPSPSPSAVNERGGLQASGPQNGQNGSCART